MNTKSLARAVASEFMHGGHIPALIAPCLVFTLGLISGDTADLTLLAIAYLIPLVVYAHDYHHGMCRDRLEQPERARHLRRRARAYPYLIGGYLALLVTLMAAYHRRFPGLAMAVGILLAAGALYTVFFKRVTRYLTGFKSYYVTGVWVLTIALLYEMYTARALAGFLPAIMAFLYVRLLANAIFYDLRDVRSDRRDGLKTIPVALGWKRTIGLLYLLCVVAQALLLAGVMAGFVPSPALGLSLFTAYNLFYVRLAHVRGEGGMTAGHYVLADIEFLLWPIMGLAIRWLDGRSSPFFTATLVGAMMVGSVLLIWLFVKPANGAKGDRLDGRVEFPIDSGA